MIDVSPLNLLGSLERMVPQGPGRDDDTALVSTGSVIDRDVDGRRVRVALRGGDVWLPAVAGRYVRAAPVRVLFDATSARPVLVLGSIEPGAPAVLGTVAAVNGTVVTVTVDGKSSTIPSVAGTYTVGQTAWILLDDWGVPVIALGPATVPAPPPVEAPPSAGGSTVTATASIGPQSSGTYRASAGRWDQWNTDRYGGASDIYQGSAYGSGQLRGFAGYGDQIANLGAVSIDEAILTARKTADGNSAVLTVQGTAAGSRPQGEPSAGPFEAAASGSIGSGGTGQIALPAGLREALRTGAARGLVAVGSQYGGFGGTATPGSFVLNLRYTRPA
ncbi:hypothetical protein QE418_000605 [Microbacterium testaceum]|uniref:hypothetical protein n=1 Tax=Microbacterium TaxID=33882 RepID=UPI00278304BE|nr:MULTISPECIES: hypothetical protein [Microbacterium]MDQ1111157.1 hypothetical protein [Microbacterium testaceum]MDR6098304.1 hypothetical protein [Microbacterium sp. SORGH_AS_0454]